MREIISSWPWTSKVRIRFSMSYIANSSVGVHSIERSAQEGQSASSGQCIIFECPADTLLVLLNAAISNLVSATATVLVVMLTIRRKVLFRNNFAMSRDIAGLFTVCM